ncbi:MAG TPA: multicopper oxidase family protein [Steroidobacteraceae bacterium]|nr:multicopper oxidase family protein [Steroidobacteraceae bacterium]
MKRLLLPVSLAAAALLASAAAHAAAPGITGPTFSLTAQPAYITQPDGQMIYSWGYGCTAAPSAGVFAPAMPNATPFCNTMQVPGPTLIVTEGQTVSVTLTNNLPTAAGNTSILFPGFTLTSTCPAAQQGLLTCEAAPGGSVTYTFVASSPGTRAYYSGTQGDLQVEMGLYGAIIVLPSIGNPSYPTAVCGTLASGGLPVTHPGNNRAARTAWSEGDFRLAAAAYDHPDTCYDREYLFQFSEIDPNIHIQALAQSTLACTGCMLVPTEPYHPAYFMINGRSMPDNMDPNYAAQYPHQPYNGNPHMHPGELTLLRIIGTGRWQHPFHEHANHVRTLARDGNLILSNGTVTYAGTTAAAPALAGPLFFTTTTTPGQAMDGIFYYTGRGLNWDMYGHVTTSSTGDANATLPCNPDANGYNTGAPTAINYFEWCQDHDKPMEKAPYGDIGAGGPMTLPNPNLFTNGAWYGGSPYLGPDATTRSTFGTCTGSNTTTSCGTTGTTPPSGTIANSPSSEAGFAFMWHSHNEREITTNNIFPGGMLMMMLVDSREFVIDESN